MKLPAGFKDLRTTGTGAVMLVAGFIAFAPELFPETELWGLWARKIAAFVAFVSGGAFVAQTPSAFKVKEKAEEIAKVVKQDTAEMVDQKIDEKLAQ